MSVNNVLKVVLSVLVLILVTSVASLKKKVKIIIDYLILVNYVNAFLVIFQVQIFQNYNAISVTKLAKNVMIVLVLIVQLVILLKEEF